MPRFDLRIFSVFWINNRQGVERHSGDNEQICQGHQAHFTYESAFVCYLD